MTKMSASKYQKLVLANKPLPANVEVDGDLFLYGCTSLTTLPEGLEVGGSLDLANCTSLTHLPKGLKVGGSLDLNRCTSLISIHTATVDELVYADLEFVERIPKDKLLLYVNFKWAVDIIKQTYLKRLALGR